MMHYDLCLAWNWEFDVEFVRLLEEACTRRGLTFLSVPPERLADILKDINSGEISFGAYFDRATDNDQRFQPLTDRSRYRNTFRINPQELQRWAEDKATMHLEFISRGLVTPYTIILPPFSEQAEIPPPNLALLGGLFSIKPAQGGGGRGVVVQASTLDQVFSVRQEFPKEKYLLQSYINAQLINGREAWFRNLYCSGRTYPFWWDTKTHVYHPVTAQEAQEFNLAPLRRITERIAGICRLDLFSSEVALDGEGKFFITDYVNDPIDLRLQSSGVDGVPDAVVKDIADRIAMLVEVHIPRTG